LVAESNLGHICLVSDLLELLYTESHFFHTHPYSGQNFRDVPFGNWNRSVMFGSAERRKLWLVSHEITCEVSQLSCDHDTSISQTDGRTTFRSNTALCIASRGKNHNSNFDTSPEIISVPFYMHFVCCQHKIA